MRKIINERGEEVVAIGEWGSIARIEQKYPDTLKALTFRVVCENKFDYQLLKQYALEECNADNDDIHQLLMAVHHFTEDLFKTKK
jgi:hypothetical protein